MDAIWATAPIIIGVGLIVISGIFIFLDPPGPERLPAEILFLAGLVFLLFYAALTYVIK